MLTQKRVASKRIRNIVSTVYCHFQKCTHNINVEEYVEGQSMRTDSNFMGIELTSTRQQAYKIELLDDNVSVYECHC